MIMVVDILNKKTGRLCKATVTKVRLKDFDKISKDRFNTFNWQDFKLSYRGLFKLMKGGEILGLMQFGIENPFQNVMELTKIELSKENIGQNKRYDYVAGCLIAFACFKTIKYTKRDMGIYYTKSTKRIYLEKYGMTPYDQYYVKSDKDNSISLIKKYLNIDCQVA